MNIHVASDKVDCWSWCASTDDCNWFSYDTTDTTGIHQCILFNNCPEIDDEQYPQFVSGRKDCYFTHCMFCFNVKTRCILCIPTFRYKQGRRTGINSRGALRQGGEFWGI